jgi:hypothetical protein
LLAAAAAGHPMMQMLAAAVLAVCYIHLLLP